MLEIWEALSHDGASACATSSLESARDIERVRASIASRGLGFLTLDLPSLDGLLLSLLENGSVCFEGPLTARRSTKDSRPKFLWQFWSLVCDANGCLLKEPDPNAIAALRQLTSVFKKIEVVCSQSRIDNAVREYYEIDSKILRPVLDWTSDALAASANLSFRGSFSPTSIPLFDRREHGSETESSGFLGRLDQVSRILISELGTFDSMSEDSPETGFFRHGPGAVSNLKGQGYKYSFPTWSEKLEGVFPFDWCASGQLGDYPPSRQEPPSALLQVPKTAKAPRLIASEPIEHQWCQQKVASWLEASMNNTLLGRFINIRNQELSQLLVASASIDGSLSTIDLSSASDRLSCRHVEALFASNRPLLEAVHAVRTRRITDRVTSRDTFILKKFASMGSALTFPVQCIFFLCVALASAGASDRKSIKALVGKVRVFGDDIIVPSYAYVSTVTNLTFLGLKVNESKSFSKGLFRESCGADYWGGFDTTPVKPKSLRADTPTGVQALIDLSNNLYKKGWWKASDRVRLMIPPRFTRRVFSHDSGVSGLVSYCGDRLGPLKWDRDLHRWYAPQPTAIKLQARVVQNNSFALREFFTRPWSALRPREMGTKRVGVAKFATLRVEPKVLEKRLERG